MFLDHFHHMAEGLADHDCIFRIHKIYMAFTGFTRQTQVKRAFLIHIQGNGVQLKYMFEFRSVLHDSKISSNTSGTHSMFRPEFSFCFEKYFVSLVSKLSHPEPNL